MKNKQSSYRYLLSNIGLLSLSSFATKILVFLLVPLYTSILSTNEYGTYDLFNTTVSVLLPILTLNIQESILRFSLDGKNNINSIVTIGVKYLLLSNILVGVGLFCNHLFELNSTLDTYSFIFFMLFFSQSVSGVMTCYTRGIGKILELAISSVITTIVLIGCNIMCLLVFRLGLKGYFIANILGPLVQSLFLLFSTSFIRQIRFKNYPFEEKKMTDYSKPLIANSIAWWVNSFSDRYIVTLFCGVAVNGVYSVADKIPAMLNIFQSIFNQAWTLSAVKEYDYEDKKCFFSNTYKTYNSLITIVCSGIILMDKFLAKFLYANDFYVAWKFVPWLTIGVLFGSLSGYIGGLFSAVKDSKVFAISTIVGAIINIVLNFIFTPIYGAMGAAVATAICYFVVWILRFIQSQKYIKLKINIQRDIVSYTLLIIQTIFLFYFDGITLYEIEILLFILISFLYLNDFKVLVLKIMMRKNNEKNSKRNYWI